MNERERGGSQTLREVIGPIDYGLSTGRTTATPFAIEQWKKDALVIPFREELEKGR
jgi:hypothetical protein